MASQCIGTSKLINTLVSERNMCSYHRYDGPIGQYSSQSDFSDGAATNRHFWEVCSSQHPQKIWKGARATFFEGKKIWPSFKKMPQAGHSQPLYRVKKFTLKNHSPLLSAICNSWPYIIGQHTKIHIFHLYPTSVALTVKKITHATSPVSHF